MCAAPHVDDQRTQLVLLQGDDLVVARLLGQLQQGARRRQTQPRHVWFPEGAESRREAVRGGGVTERADQRGRGMERWSVGGGESSIEEMKVMKRGVMAMKVIIQEIASINA